jgi:hypothetical protein
LNVNASFTRNNYFFYNYQYSIRYYYGGSPVPNGFVDFQGVVGGDFGVLNDYLYLGVGLKYNFLGKFTLRNE